MVCAGNPKLWRLFCDAIWAAGLCPPTRASPGNSDRLRHRAVLVGIIEAISTTMTVDAFIARLDTARRAVLAGSARSARPWSIRRWRPAGCW